MTADVITFNPTDSMEGFVMSDFCIIPYSGTPGRHGIYANVVDAPKGISKCVIQRLYIRSKNGRAIYVDNPVLDHDAFFLTTIQDCVLSGGIVLMGGGDSINIHRNTINIASGATQAGANPGIVAKLISESDPYANGNSKLLSIAFNNIVATEAIRIDAGDQTHIYCNNMECNPLWSAVSTTSAMINIAGDATHRVDGCTIIGNYVGLSHGAHDGIRIDYGRNCVIEGNTITPGGGVWTNWPTTPETYASGWRGIRTTTNSNYTHIGKNNFPYPDWSGAEGNVASAAGQATAYQATNQASKTISAAGTHYPFIQDAQRWIFNVTTSDAFTVGYPANLGSARIGPLLAGFTMTLTIKNLTAGALGAITFESAYVFASPFVAPEPGKHRSITFMYDGANWMEVSRS